METEAQLVNQKLWMAVARVRRCSATASWRSAARATSAATPLLLCLILATLAAAARAHAHALPPPTLPRVVPEPDLIPKLPPTVPVQFHVFNLTVAFQLSPAADIDTLALLMASMSAIPALTEADAQRAVEATAVPASEFVNIAATRRRVTLSRREFVNMIHSRHNGSIASFIREAMTISSGMRSLVGRQSVQFGSHGHLRVQYARLGLVEGGTSWSPCHGGTSSGDGWCQWRERVVAVLAEGGSRPGDA